MITGIDPKVDYVFKWLFGKENNTVLLLSLLNAVLKLPPERTIVSLEILNPFNEKDALNDKLSILDIKARDQHGNQYNIEMQMRGTSLLPRRLVYYWARLHASQLKKGDDYDKLYPTITICFVNTVLFPDVPDYHLQWELRSDRHPHLVFTDQQAIHLVELPKFKKSAAELVDVMDAWCYLLIHGETMETNNLPEVIRAHSAVAKAMEELAVFAQNDVERQRYEDRVKAARDYRSFLKEEREVGREEGREEGEVIGRIRLAQELLKLPVSPKEELAALPIVELRTMAERLQGQFLKQ